MSDLIAIAFDNMDNAQQALSRAVSMQKEHLLDLGDAVIITKDEDGKVVVAQQVGLQQSINTTAMGAAQAISPTSGSTTKS